MNFISYQHAKKHTVAVIGLGYVGLPLALLSAQKGYKVIGINKSSQKVDLIKQRKSPFVDELVEHQLKATKMEATTDFSRVREADIIIICVPTPVYEDRMPNYEPVETACRQVGEYLQKGQLVILESTVNPGVCDDVVLPLLASTSGLSKDDFYLAHCPERINPGDKKWNVSNIPRVVGGLNQESLNKAVAFYKSIIKGEIKPMKTLQEAEAVKVVENSFRNVNIAFVNELAKSFAKLNIDVVNVINGAATKPFAFMPHYPGCGIGGHCIPVDPYYLIEHARKKNGFSHDFLALACKTNEGMPAYTVSLLEEGLATKNISVKHAKIVVLGLAYKKDIGDCRESPAFEIIKHLQEKCLNFTTFDPFVLDKSTSKSLEKALKNADGVILATDHTEFRSLNGMDFAKYGVKVVIDGRNCLNKENFDSHEVTYRGIGR